jgi:hypothetical protein
MSRRQGGDFGRKVYHKFLLLWFIRIYRPFRSRELFPSIEVVDVLVQVEHLLLLKRCARLEAETIGDDGRFECGLIGNHCARDNQLCPNKDAGDDLLSAFSCSTSSETMSFSVL